MKKKVLKFTHTHESHHGFSKAERWLSRETHKMLAEFGVLVLAALTAEYLLTWAGQALRGVLHA